MLRLGEALFDLFGLPWRFSASSFLRYSTSATEIYSTDGWMPRIPVIGLLFRLGIGGDGVRGYGASWQWRRPRHNWRRWAIAGSLPMRRARRSAALRSHSAVSFHVAGYLCRRDIEGALVGLRIALVGSGQCRRRAGIAAAQLVEDVFLAADIHDRRAMGDLEMIVANLEILPEFVIFGGPVPWPYSPPSSGTGRPGSGSSSGHP